MEAGYKKYTFEKKKFRAKETVNTMV